MRYISLMRRLERLEPEPPWIDTDEDGFLSAVGALPGESFLDALERQAATIWADRTEDGKE
jgi:hypothetical protein